MKIPATDVVYTAWVPWKVSLASIGIVLLLLLWGARRFTEHQNAVPLRQEHLSRALQAAGVEFSRSQFPVTSDTTVTVRSQRQCPGAGNDRICFAFDVTAAHAPRAPASEEHFMILLDAVSGEAVVVPNANR